jgi:hypothetical protein
VINLPGIEPVDTSKQTAKNGAVFIEHRIIAVLK